MNTAKLTKIYDEKNPSCPTYAVHLDGRLIGEVQHYDRGMWTSHCPGAQQRVGIWPSSTRREAVRRVVEAWTESHCVLCGQHHREAGNVCRPCGDKLPL